MNGIERHMSALKDNLALAIINIIYECYLDRKIISCELYLRMCFLYEKIIKLPPYI